MSGAIRELRDYLAKSPSVIYPEDVLAYLPAIETENAKLRQELAIRNVSEQEKVIEYLRQESIGWEDKYRALASENAKLRVLLEAVLQCAGEIKRDKGCDACPMYNGPLRNDGFWCLLRPTLRELGVDDG